MMMGSSAPKGSPVPIGIAEESGFSTATFASSLLLPSRMASRASRIPWPRILSERYRAIKPTIREPATGTKMRPRPKWLFAGDEASAEKRKKKARFVTTLINQIRATAIIEANSPTMRARQR